MTGDPTDYTDEDVWDLVRWLNLALNRHAGAQGRMTITADIEWAGEYNPRRHRTTTFWSSRGLDLTRIRPAVEAALRARHALENLQARPAPKSLGARINFLQRTKAGRDAWTGAGLNVSAGTLRRWRAGTQAPSKANRQRLDMAVGQLREQQLGGALSRADKAAHAAANALTAAIGEPVRFFNVSGLELS